MYRLFQYLFFLGLIIFMSLPLRAQLPPNQPEQDCINAIEVCNMDTIVQLQAYTGLGLNEDEITNENSCLGKGTTSEVWYIFTVQQSGNLCFTITQFDTLADDYDWALFNITNATCADIINGNVTSFGGNCNFGSNELGCGGRTGANGETGGDCQEQNEPCIPVIAGEVYVLNIASFEPSDRDIEGFFLDWNGSTAIIGDNEPPRLDFAFQECDNNTITVGFSENVVCQTVTPTDFSITGPDGNHVVTRIDKPDCDNGASTFADSFVLEINPAITVSGQYTVSLTGEVLDICGFAAELPNSQTINLNTLPAIVGATPQAICTGDSSTLQITGLNNPGQYNIKWTPGNLSGAAVTVNPDSTTTYNVRIQDSSGCLRFQDSIEISVLPSPTSTFTATDSLCTNQSGTITYTGEAPIGASFTWNFDGGQVINGSAAGPYEVQWDEPGLKNISLVVESNGCISDLTEFPITIFQTPSTELSVPEEACENNEINVLYSGNASANAEYQWGFNGGILLRQDTAIGPGPFALRYENDGIRTISLTITENGCSASTSQNISINPLPISEIAQLPDQCLNNNEFRFRYSGPNDNIEEYNWDFGDGNGSTLANPTHRYNNSGRRIIQLGVIDENGCLAIGTDTVEVFDEPTADFTMDNGCIREKISFENLSSTPPTTRIERNEWNYGDGTVSIQINPSHRYQTSGNFRVSLRVITEDGCTDTTSSTVQIFPTPDADFETDHVCLGDTTTFVDLSTLDALNNDEIVSWAWDFGDGRRGGNLDSVIHNYNATGSYQVNLRVESNNGCADSITKDITIFPSNQPIQGIGDTVCFGESALLTIDSVATGSRVDWYNTDTSSFPFFTGLTLVTEPLLLNQNFFVESTSPQGCISARATVRANVIPRATGQIVVSDTVVEIPNAIVNFRLAGNVLGEEFSWSFGDGEQSTSDQPAHQYQFPGKYNVNLQVIDVNGCEYRFSDVIEVIKLADLFAPSAFSPNGDGVNDNFFVVSRLVRQFQIQVFNRWGKMVFESNDPNFRWDGSSMNGETLQEGVYIYLVKAQDSEGDLLEESGSVTIIR